MEKSRRISCALMAVLSCFAGLNIFGGCQTVPTNVAAPKPTSISISQNPHVERGRELYVSLLKCALCHRPKPVYDYDPETWQNDILPKMAKKSKLKPDDYAAVLAYVTSAEAQQRPQ